MESTTPSNENGTDYAVSKFNQVFVCEFFLAENHRVRLKWSIGPSRSFGAFDAFMWF
jgi:hypothetical protein